MDVQIFSYYRPDSAQKLHPQFLKYELDKRVTYGVHPPLNRVKKYTKFFIHLSKYLASHKTLKILKTVNVLKLGLNSFNLQYFFKALLFRQQSEFDIIHCHFGPIGQDIVELREMGFVKGKIVTSFHGYDFQRRSILKEYNNYRVLFSLGDGFIANSFFTNNQLQKLGCTSTKLTTIPVSFAGNIFVPSISESSDQVYSILTVARLEEVKGIAYALQAVSKLKHFYKINFHYEIIGAGSLQEDLLNLADNLGIADHVKFLGSRTQDFVLKHLYKADVFLLTSITSSEGAAEAQGLVLLEAQAAGVPVVASRTGGVPDSLIEGVTGLLVPEKDPDEIARALEALYRDPERRKEMGSRGITFVKANFDPAILNAKIFDFYKSVISRT